MVNECKSAKNGKKEGVLAIILGVVTGVVNGLFGGGGGMVVVPALEYLLKLPEKKAHATAVFVILPLCMISAVLYAKNGVMEWKTGLIVTIGVAMGGFLGALLLKKLSNKWIFLIFSLVMAVAGVKLLFF